MRKFLNFLRDMVAVVLVLAVTFGAGYYFGCYANKEESVVVE